MKVVVLHGSSNELALKLDSKCVSNKSKFNLKIFLVQFLKNG
jgi:hypothetical protein